MIKGILFVRPDFHSTFSLVDKLIENGYYAKIFVGWNYPDKLLFSKKNVLGLRLLLNKNFLFKIINVITNIFSMHQNVLF